MLHVIFREVKGHNYLLEGKANFSLSEASRSIAYKYVVVPSSQGNAKGKIVKDRWECLIGFKPLNPTGFLKFVSQRNTGEPNGRLEFRS